MYANSKKHHFIRTLKMLLLGVLIFSCLFSLNQFKLSNYFPIKTVRVYGINRVDRAEVQTLLLPLVNRGFFTVNLDYIRDRLLQMPWIADIFVHRHWPDQVEITIVEKNAIARWNQQALLSETGEVFVPNQATFPLHLPELRGPDGKQMVVLQYFNAMNHVLLPLHVTISSLELSPYLAWKLKLNNGLTLQIGHTEILTRLNHFVKVYPKIFEKRVADVEYVDLRYPNGMAVRLKSAAKTAVS